MQIPPQKKRQKNGKSENRTQVLAITLSKFKCFAHFGSRLFVSTPFMVYKEFSAGI